MNDGLQTTAELQNMIFAAAQRSRASYQDTANTVTKLGILAGNAFSSNQEMVAFAEQLNKQFVIGGASVQESSAAMYQLSQAMASGRLQGDEFRSIMENAPMLAQAIASYMGKTTGELREMSSQGLITSDVIKNALFYVAEETEERFNKMPKTIGQIWTSIKNTALKEFQPVLTKINEVVNNPRFNQGMQKITLALVSLAGVALSVFETVGNAAAWVGDNWSTVAQIIMGVVGAYIAYNAVALITNGILAAQVLVAKVKAAADMMQAGATFTATVAQHGLNAALWACPITWIIALIIALIVVFIIFTEQIVGAIWWLGALFKNIGLWIANVAIGVWNSIKNIGLWFANLGLGIWEVLKACANNVLAAFQNAWINIQIGFIPLYQPSEGC
jgi:tape measure domain-containing protein